MKIFLDAGHGGSNPGAVSPINGLTEDFVNLDVVLRLGRILTDSGYEVNYSRTTDTDLSLAQRANLANRWGADYFISVHCNSNPIASIGGTETFFYREGTVAEDFALAVNTALVNQINLRNIGISARNLAVLRLTDMPAILVELAFLTNPQEAELLAQDTFREQCAVGISIGVRNFVSP